MSEKEYICEICGSKAYSIYTLERHKKTAKCQNIQLSNRIKQMEKERLQLEKELEQEKDRRLHAELQAEKRINEHIREINEQMREMYSVQNSALIDIAKEPKTVTNNNNNTINLGSYINPNDIIKDNLTYEQVQDGVDGVARCIAEHNYDENGKKRYIISDCSRRVVKYRDSDDEIIRDPGCAQMIKSMRPALSAKAREAKDKLMKMISGPDADETTILIYSRLLVNNVVPMIKVDEDTRSKLANSLNKALLECT